MAAGQKSGVRVVAAGLAATLTLAAPPGHADTAAEPDYAAGILAWQQQRRATLLGRDGFVNLAGLYWLTRPVSTFGSAPDNDVRFPSPAAAHLGEFRLTNAGVEMVPAQGAGVVLDGRTVGAVDMADDTTDNPVTITSGSLAWTVIKRDGRFAVRLRDYEHPRLATFPALEYFPVDAGWAVEATLQRYAEVRETAVHTVIEGLGWNPESPGEVVFEKDGATYRLEAYVAGDRLFFVFGDRTNGRETYPAGRFLYAAMPGADGRTLLDFNRAYSPPCAFNDFATCPVASPRNRLPIAVTAGELFNRAAYVGRDTAH